MRLVSLSAALASLGMGGVASAAAPDPVAEKPVSFSRDIRPILSSNCFHCHGPDEKNRKAHLRLDIREGALRARGRAKRHPVVAGKPGNSEIIARLTARDADDRMPPSDSGKKVTPEQIDLIRRWISQGATWGKHWAFEPPLRPKPPRLATADDKSPDGAAARVNNPIDNFIFNRLDHEGLSPSPEADRATLLRRLSLDLIGLPPTPEEIDAFLADKTSSAWNRQIDRLLGSKHYGERWGRIWLDAARYADSDGYEKDKPREVWFYRDWVINALNQDMPYDQFVIDQIAGDLLPKANQDDVVATGFLRNSMLNEEGGIDPEEFRMAAMFDRMDAIGKAVLGFTLQCAQCHNHKYDPLSQEDYYRLLSYLNNSYEAQPMVYTKKNLQKWAALSGKISRIESSLKNQRADWMARMEEWEQSVKSNQPEWTVLKLKNSSGNNGQRYFEQENGSYLAQGYAPTKLTAPFDTTTDLPEIRSFQIEMLNHPNLPGGGPGRGLLGRFSLSEFQVKAESIRDPKQKVSAKFVRATADYGNKRTKLKAPYLDKRDGESAGFTGPVEYAIDGDNKTGWGADAGPERRNRARKAVFVTDQNVAFPGGTRLTITLVQRQGGWNSDDNQTMNLGCFRISITGKEVVADPLPIDVREIVENIPQGKRTPQQSEKVFGYWRTTVPEWKTANDEIEALWSQHPEGTTQFVYQEMKRPRQTHLLKRGDFLQPAELVTPGLPSFLHPPSPGVGTGRLAFARWLVDRQSPTAARAIVNRIWQSYFGTGIVATTDDLGSSGASPSHPDLLDWLAVELMDSGWSLKHIHRLITQSATYRQSSVASAALETRDPENRLLARGPRFRVDAEIVRDIFLAASGLLNPEVGGPSVYPPAPAFLFERPASYGPKNWDYDTGPEKYRRAIYTFRFRSVPYPVLQAFDAPSGRIATVRRARSNTPLQALATLNESLFVESAQALARTTVARGGKSDAERLTYLFRRCVARRPGAAESALLLKLLAEQTARFENGELDPEKVLTPPAGPDGKAPPIPHQPDGITAAQLGAWTVVSRVVLNLDETITKE